MWTNLLCLSIIFFPLVGFVLTLGCHQLYGTRSSVWISIGFLAVSCLGSLYLLVHHSVVTNTECHIVLAPWISSGAFSCSWGFWFDTLTHVMLVTVTTVSLLVHLYSSEYMGADPHLPRFMSYLSLFTFFMLLLVSADNLIQMFVGWEGVGFCSFLLINFWFTRLQANKAAIKAMLVNRVSDFALVLGILTLWATVKSVDYASVFACAPLFQEYQISMFNHDVRILDAICILFFLGAMGKSAQLFLHVWLPDAMEGPTPVSALIHAATMVTAGIFLIARCSPLFELSALSLDIITVVGAMTAFFASSVGLVQNDLKKIIAYSTCSQLGYMVFACGLSNYALGVFHLSNHAYFKALLFLSAGSVIHAMSDEQDIRKMGGLRRLLPFTYAMFVIGSLALMGFPFLTGFYSKDVILEVAYAAHHVPGHFAYWLGTVAACFTAFYSTRLLYFTFLGEPNGHRVVTAAAHDAPFKMALPLGILALYSLFVGYGTKDMFIGLGSPFFGNALFVLPTHVQLIDAEFLPLVYKLLPVGLSLVSVTVGLSLYALYFHPFALWKVSTYGLPLYTFLNKKWYFDKVYNEYVNQYCFQFGYRWSYQVADKGFIEFFGPRGLSELLFDLSRRVTQLQTGFLYHYALVFVFSAIALLFIFLTSFFFPTLQWVLLFFLLFYWWVDCQDEAPDGEFILS